MMSSRVLSRLLPVAEGDVSVYENLMRDHTRYADLEAQHETGAAGQFHDDDDDPEALLYDARHEQDPSQSATVSPETPAARKWLGTGGKRRVDEDEDVPESLLLEPRGKTASSTPASNRSPTLARARTDAQWRATQQQHGLHAPASPRQARAVPANVAISPGNLQAEKHAQAMWQYTNASNLDAFLLEVYEYYVSHGVWSMLLSRALSLLTELFVFSFAIYLTTCVDYRKIPTSKSSSEILIPKCMVNASKFKDVVIFFFILYWCGRLAAHIADCRRLFRMQFFYQYGLGINDQDIQTVTWPQVVDGLVKLQNANIATAKPDPTIRNYTKYTKPQQRMNAESIANRLMRQDNYYVAMYNKEILDFTLPLPFVGSRQFYSKSLEWCINFSLTNFIFNEEGNIRPFCLEVRRRRALAEALRNRLRVTAIVSIIISPFNIVRFCLYFFFKYYTEFTRNPAKASARAFTPHAEWKIRQFNELDHLFQRRLRQAMPFADEYLKQFPKDKSDQIYRFIAFITGALAAVLALMTLFDSELFLGFEITPGRTAFFYFTILGSIWAFAHGQVPEEYEVYDPVKCLNDVLMYTNYKPKHWKNRMHSSEVRAEFSGMYQMRIIIFLEEILSLVVTPWILLRNSGTRCERVIDFFREQTVHVDGIGYQCNFAVFHFKKDPNAEDPATVLQEHDGLRDDYYGLKDDKMLASVQNFAQYYSHYNHYNRRAGGARKPQGWQPPPAWPPLLSPSIAEEGQPSNAIVAQRAAAVKHSGMLSPHQRSLHSSPRQPVRSTRDARASSSRSDTVTHRAAVSGARHAPGITESRMMSEDDDLRDAAHPEREYVDTDTEADGEDGEGEGVGGAGVLGMLYQFSKAQTEKGPGVKI
jgi:autophagy-related protein 9